MTLKRISSGVPGLDEVLFGGLIRGRTYLLVGLAGTGKTIFAIQWMQDGSSKGEMCLYITLAEPAKEIRLNVSEFGWRLDKIDFVDMTPVTELEGRELAEYHIFPPSEVEQIPVWQKIYSEIERKEPNRVVIDPATNLKYLSTDEYQFRKNILRFVNFLNGKGCTSMLIYEPTELEKETSISLAVDGVIRLDREISKGRVIDIRSLRVEKFRGSDYLSGLHPMRITSNGIVIFPHRIERPSSEIFTLKRLKSGISQLDELLDGGIEEGTSTIISGPTGVGKSTLGLQFLSSAISFGEKAVLYTFEEPAGFIIQRAKSTGIDIDEMIETDKLKIHHINPLEFYPDEFLDVIRHDVENDGRKFVQIDSLRGYNLAMEQFGTIPTYIQNTIAYLNRQHATTFLINEIEHITGDLVLTELGVSFIVDNAILLRYAEVDGKVIRVINCLKKRLGSFHPELREFTITSEGIKVGEKLVNLHGLLTGVPERTE